MDADTEVFQRITEIDGLANLLVTATEPSGRLLLNASEIVISAGGDDVLLG